MKWDMDQLIESGSIKEGLQQSDTLSRWRTLHAPRTLCCWPEYLIEAGGLGLYTFFACAFTPCYSTLLRPSDSLSAATWLAGRFMDRHPAAGFPSIVQSMISALCVLTAWAVV